MMGARHRGALRPGSPMRCRCGAMVVEGSMTQGAGQGPEVRTPTVRDFRAPAYAHEADPYAQPAPYAQPGPYPQPGYPQPGPHLQQAPHAQQMPPGEGSRP